MSEDRAHEDAGRPPPLPLFLVEGQRAFLESLTLVPASPLLASAPAGDGHPVLVMPGFAAGDSSTRLLRRYLQRLGYSAEPWTLGRNMGPTSQLRERLVERVVDVHRAHRRNLTLVGWSLGGIYAREIAKRMPDRVRQVVTLGSPFANAGRGSNASRLFDFVSRRRVRTASGLSEMLRVPPACPTTSIFSKTDGVVAWRACLEPDTDHTENIEVPGSHFGLGFNPLVLYALADRVSQPEGAWKPFDRSGWRRRFYGRA